MPHFPAPYRLPLTSDDPNEVMRRAITYAFAIAPLYRRADGGAVDEPEGFAGGGGLKRAVDLAKGIIAYHGSPHAFDRFDISKIGTGEGAQAYGHGLYFADAEPVAKQYSLNNEGKYSPGAIARRMISGWNGDRDVALQKLQERIGRMEGQHDENFMAPYRGAMDIIRSGEEPKVGHMYQVRINADPEHFLDWDKPLSEQPHVADALSRVGALKDDGSLSFMYNEVPRRGGEMYERLTSPLASKITGGDGQSAASNALREAGIPGIKYLDQGSRSTGDGSRNWVLFDDKPIEILRRYADGGMIQDRYPSHYMPGVGRQVMADGGAPAYSAPITGQHTITAQDLIGTAAPSGQTYGAYTDAGGQKIAAPFVSSMSGGYPVYNIPKQGTTSGDNFDLQSLMQRIFGRQSAFNNYTPFLGKAEGGPVEEPGSRAHDFVQEQLYGDLLRPSPLVDQYADKTAAAALQANADRPMPTAHEFVQHQLNKQERQLPQMDREARDTMRDYATDALHLGAYFTPAAPVIAAYDAYKGLQSGNPLEMGLAATGLPGKAAKAGMLAASLMYPTEAQAGPVNKALEVARRLSPFGHYSPAAEAVAGIKQEKGRIGDFLNAIKGKPGVTADELRHAGIESAFAPDATVTRDEVADFLHNRLPQIQEKIYGGAPITHTPREIDPSEHYGEDDVPGWLRAMYEVGPRNRPYVIKDAGDEYYLHGPKDDNLGDYTSFEAAVQAAHDAMAGRDPVKYGEYALPGGERYREVTMQLPPTGSGSDRGFRSQHWSDPNVLAHLRMSDRTTPEGARALHLDEIQSDWGQIGRDRGFKNAGEPSGLSGAESDEFRSLNVLPDAVRTPEQTARLNELFALADRRLKGAPEGPYVTSTEGWTDLALKRALREAAEGGYDKMVWTPGAAQADRYNLSKRVDEIAYNPRTGYFKAKLPRAGTGINGQSVGPNTPVKPEELASYIGKEGAKRLLAQEPNNLGLHVLQGDDLSFGGHGMLDYYDKVVPSRLQKLIKKLGHSPLIEMASHELPSASGDGSIMGHALHMTPELREAILKGLPAFEQGGRVGYEDGGGIVDRALSFLSQLNPVGTAEAAPSPLVRRVFEAVRHQYAPGYVNDLSKVKLTRPVSEMDFKLGNERPMLERQIVEPEQFAGSAFVPAFGDRSRSGAELFAINGQKLRRPVNLQGGESFMRDAAAQSDDFSIWGGAPAPSGLLARKGREAAERGHNPYLIYSAMGPESSDYSHMTTDTLLGLMNRKRIAEDVAADFDSKMRRNFKTLDPIPAWPGLRSNGLEDWLYGGEEAAGLARTKMAKVMDAASFRKAGMPEVGAVRAAITEPGLLGVPSYASGHSIGALDPAGRVIESPLHPHSSYSTQVGAPHGSPGYVGGFEYSVPADIHFKDEIERILAEKPDLPESNIHYTLRRRAPVVEATPEWVDNNSEFIDLMRREYGRRAP